MKCPSCNKNKHKTSFSKDGTRPNGLCWQCKECAKKSRQSSYCAARQKIINIKTKYKVTTEEIKLLMKIVHCDLCGKKISWTPGAKTRAMIDHCHDSNQVRGILCSSCNTGLGKIGDTVATVKRALSYVTNPPGIYRERKAAS